MRVPRARHSPGMARGGHVKGVGLRPGQATSLEAGLRNSPDELYPGSDIALGWAELWLSSSEGSGLLPTWDISCRLGD